MAMITMKCDFCDKEFEATTGTYDFKSYFIVGRKWCRTCDPEDNSDYHRMVYGDGSEQFEEEY